MQDKLKMFDEICDIMDKEMAPTLGCTGPILFILSSTCARELVGGNEIKHIKCVANGRFAARMGEVVTPGLPEDNLEIACAAGAVAGDSSRNFEVIKGITPEQVAKALELSKDRVEVIADWDAPAFLYVDTTVETECGTGRVIYWGANIILKEKNGEVIFKSDKQPGQEANVEEKKPISKFSVEDLYTFCKEVPIERLEFLRQAMRDNEAIGRFGSEHDLGAGIGQAFSKLADDPVTRVKALTSAASEARMMGVGMRVLSVCGTGNLGISTLVPTLALAKELGKSEDEGVRAVAMACLISIRLVSQEGESAFYYCSCLSGACQAAAAGYVMLHDGGPEDIERAIQNTIPATFGAVCDGPRNACAMRMISAVGTGYDAAKLALAGVVVPLNEGVLGVTSQDTIDILEYMSHHVGDMYTPLMKKVIEKRPLTPKREKKPLPEY